MPHRAVFILLVLLSFGAIAAAQQSYELVVAGENLTCGITTPYVYPEAVFHYVPSGMRTIAEIAAVAAGPNGTLYGLLRDSSIVLLTPDASLTPFFGGVPSSYARAIAVAPSGRIFVTLATGGQQSLLVVSATGAQEALYPLADWIGNTNLAVANDGCTVYYTPYVWWQGTAIKRINGCAGAALPDLVALTDVRDIEVTPAGELLVARGTSVLLYSPTGTLIRTVITLDAAVEQVSLRDGVLWLAGQGPSTCQTELRRIVFDTGAETGTRKALYVVIPSSLVVGNAAQANVPMASGVTLMLLAVALAAGGAVILGVAR